MCVCVIIEQVRVMLRVAGDPTSSTFLSVDKKRKQLTLQEPGHVTLSDQGPAQPAPDSRRVGVAAPKMFAFDGLFTSDDSQVTPLKLIIYLTVKRHFYLSVCVYLTAVLHDFLP